MALVMSLCGVQNHVVPWLPSTHSFAVSQPALFASSSRRKIETNRKTSRIVFFLDKEESRLTFFGPMAATTAARSLSLASMDLHWIGIVEECPLCSAGRMVRTLKG